jgi:salicylate hydroxylase
MDLGPEFVERFGYRYMVMHRSDLLEALLNAVRRSGLVALENNRCVTAVAIDGEVAKVECSDGTTFETYSLVGADGNMSVVRKSLFDSAVPQGQGYVVYRGTVPFQNMTEDAKGDAIVLYVGDAVHLIQYPIRGGELYNQAATFLSKMYRTDCDDWGTVSELEEAFADVAPIVAQSLQCVDRSIRWPLRDLEPFRPWRRGPAVLIGDAAHAMYQYMAQGACQALEDAVTLAKCLADHPHDPPTAFSDFEQRRVLRTSRVQLTARNFGEVIHYGGLAAEVRDAILRARNPRDYSHVEWLYADHGYL